MRAILSKLLKSISIAILMYLAISRAWNTYVHSKIIVDYQSEVTSTSADLSRDLEAARQYNEALFDAGTNHIAEYAERSVRAAKQRGASGSGNAAEEDVLYGRADDPEYEGLLNLGGDGMMGYVDIPSIGVSLPIYHYTTDEVLAKGVGHLYGTSLPVGGENTHSVITGHRGLPSSKLFTDLDKVKVGDTFSLYVLGEELDYQVDEIDIVLPDEISSLSIVPGEDLVTLVTCTPYGVNTHRLLVRGHRITKAENTVQVANRNTEEKAYRFLTTSQMTYLIGIIGLVAGGTLLIVIWRKR
jgi:sortase A